MENTEEISLMEVMFVINKMKRAIVTAAANAGEGHIPSAFSILDIIEVLYGRVLHIDPNNPESDDRDRFILSKGHGSLALYAVLAERGFFPTHELDRFATFESPLGGHPDRNKIPGVEASTGSLGHGFPMAVGVALALKIKQSSCRVYTLVGDGECNEGTVWESALLASHHKLDNLCCILDYNHSTDRALSIGNPAEKFISFGWESCTIDGHDHEQVNNALIRRHEGRPYVIVANTIKGYGCKRMENNPEWHHKVPAVAELTEIIKELA
ncbi:MAG: transketolase [Chloroflexota bacterium]